VRPIISVPTMYEPDTADQQRLAELREQEHLSPDVSERRAAAVVSGSAVVAMAALWLVPVDGDVSVLALVACVVALFVTTLVRFDVGGGFTVPVQLAFVPLLFAVPPQVVPLATVVAVAGARLPGVLQGRTSPGRLIFSFGNAWFSVGPAALLAAIGGAHRLVDQPAWAVAVFAAQFAGDFAASSVRELLVRELPVTEQLREAAWVYGVDLALTPVPLVMLIEGAGPLLTLVTVATFVALIASFAHERKKRLDGMLELNHAYHGTALLLGDVVEADDSYTGEHCKSVVEGALDVGRHLGLNADRMRNLEFSALLHDVGKVAIPKEIINKPGKLDAHEWQVIKTHTIEGQRMLDRVGGFMQEVGRIVRSHHERWDGGGYPDGLAGEQIPIEARIVTACDSYNAMTTTRSYRQAMPVTEAIKELRAHSGTQFDPSVVDALIATLGDHHVNDAEQPAALPRAA
jgi:putative nucleotidyltransferase with HDIG domain